MHLPEPALPDLPAIAHAGKPVLTTELLACCYGVQPKAIHDNFQDNRDRFIEGVHYFDLTDADLRAFKGYPENSGVVAKNARQMKLWTERGAARHAKMLSNDAAWAVFDKLEAAYFNKSVKAAKAAVAIADESTAIFERFFGVATLIGYDKPIAALSANRATHGLTGFDVLKALGSEQLVSERQERVMTPTDIGGELGGLSGMAVNRLLVEHGFQTETRDAKGRPVKRPTAAGEPFGVWVDSGKKHGDGTIVHYLKWSERVVPALQSIVDAQQLEGALR